MPALTPTQQLLAQVTSLAFLVASHVSGEAETKEMTKAMYKILVTGNGQLPLSETVRQHSAWIEERDGERKENKQDKKDTLAITVASANKDRSEAVAFRRQLWILAIGEIATFLLLGAAVLLKWK